MQGPRRTVALAAVATLFLLSTGCPHRSPVWSPDGKLLLVLAGGKAEEVDQPAPELWLVEVASGEARKVPPPAKGVRYLAALWLSDTEYLVATGTWQDDIIVEGTEAFWKRRLDGEWTELDVPPPSGTETTRRLPILLEREGRKILVYNAGSEKVIAAELSSGKVLHELEPAWLAGPGPSGGFLAYGESPSGATDLIAVGADREVLWRRGFGELRQAMAEELGKEPNEVIFDQTSTSHRPTSEKQSAEKAGVTFVFADISWRDGVQGYYAHLDAKDGTLLRVVGAKCLSGRPESASGEAWCVTAPRSAKDAPSIEALDLETGKAARSRELTGISKEEVHGYSLGPGGRKLAVSIGGETPRILIHEREPGEPRTIELR